MIGFIIYEAAGATYPHHLGAHFLPAAGGGGVAMVTGADRYLRGYIQEPSVGL